VGVRAGYQAEISAAGSTRPPTLPPIPAPRPDSLAPAAGSNPTIGAARKRLTSLTGRGRALVEERGARFAPRYRAALAEFSDDELHTAAAVLERLGEMFDKSEEIEQQP
jgi:hypothetical protein